MSSESSTILIDEKTIVTYTEPIIPSFGNRVRIDYINVEVSPWQYGNTVREARQVRVRVQVNGTNYETVMYAEEDDLHSKLEYLVDLALHEIEAGIKIEAKRQALAYAGATNGT